MKLNFDATGIRRISCVPTLIGLALTLMLFAPGLGAQTQAADPKPAETKQEAQAYQTLHVTNLAEEHDAADISADLRNMLPRAKIYFVQSQGALSIRANPEDMLVAQKIVSDLARAKKVYRITYTITEMDGGKNVGAQHFSLVVVSGGKTDLKLGSKVPIVTGSTDGSAANSQVQYLDVGLSIEASVDGYIDGMRLRSKVQQSSVAEEKSAVGPQDPVVRQTVLDGTSALVPGKPLVLGSIDVPGTTRHQEIEVVSELVQ